jgi:ArsR family transcriptional regulator
MNLELAKSAEIQADICSVFSNPKRILILWSLVAEDKSVSVIAEEIGASLQNTSQHLRLMKDKGILSSTRIGQSIIYRISDQSYSRNCLLISQVNQKMKE